jgi:26S proteasome non-ATPase regulatory subunit 9
VVANGAASNGSAPAAPAAAPAAGVAAPAEPGSAAAGAGAAASSSGGAGAAAAAAAGAAAGTAAAPSGSLRPFAVVDDVADGSPAADAGIQLVGLRGVGEGWEQTGGAGGPLAESQRCQQQSQAAPEPPPLTRPPPRIARQGDQLCRFGDVSMGPQPGDELTRVAAALQAHEGAAVEVVFLRHGAPVALSLTPRRWAGRGLLGCHLRPLGRGGAA